MTYDDGRSSMNASVTLPPYGRVPTWTWQAVQDRMAEAMRHWWRSPDGEARFNLGGRISSIWRQAFTEDQLALIDQVGLEVEAPKALPLSRADMARRDEATEWLAYVKEDDRRLVVLVLIYLAKGDKKVPWSKLKRRLGVPFGADGLRKRFSRAITDVANVLNTAENRQGGVSSPQSSPPSKKTVSAAQPE